MRGGDEAILFQDGQRVVFGGYGQSVREIHCGLALGKGGLPETKLNETVLGAGY